VIEKNSVPYQLAYNSSVTIEQTAYTRVINMLYFFKIDSFYNI